VKDKFFSILIPSFLNRSIEVFSPLLVWLPLLAPLTTKIEDLPLILSAAGRMELKAVSTTLAAIKPAREDSTF
jgi:hypothetical protein